MINNFNQCLVFTLKQEGGWSDDPRDPGGCTMQGVTLAAYRAWKRDKSLCCDDLKRITSSETADLYKIGYWNPVFGDELPSGVDLMVWDMAVNAGVLGSSKLLQASLVGVQVDGSIGPATLSAVVTLNPASLINNLAAHQADYYKSLAGFIYFGTGWLNRVDARRSVALSMAANIPPVIPSPKSVAKPVHDTDVPPKSFWTFLDVLFPSRVS